MKIYGKYIPTFMQVFLDDFVIYNKKAKHLSLSKESKPSLAMSEKVSNSAFKFEFGKVRIQVHQWCIFRPYS